MELYENIRKRRLQLNMSQQELSELVGYTSGKSMIAKIESGKVDLTQSKIIEIAKALRITPGELMGWEDELTEENADFSIDMLDDPIFVGYAKKLFSADDSIKKQVYNYIDFLLREQSPD